jgi:hypothetical protein
MWLAIDDVHARELFHSAGVELADAMLTRGPHRTV